MKILMFNWRDIKNPAAGGAEVLTHEIAKRLVLHGHEFTLFASGFPNCKKQETIDGVRIIRDGGQFSVYWKAFMHYKKYFQGRFDVVIDQINTVPFFSNFFVKEKKLVLIHKLCREIWFFEKPFPISIIGYLLEPLWLWFYRNIPAITVSESTKRDLQKYGFRNISIIPEGIDFKPVEKPLQKESNAFVFVGRLKKSKRPDHAIRTVALAKKAIPDIRLWIVGSGDPLYITYLKDLAKKNNLEQNIVFFGRVDQEKRNELMSRAQAILVTSVREGWGLIVTEANACGTCAIAYNVNGLRDSVKNNETGLLVEPNPEALAEAIAKLSGNKKILETLSQNALNDSKKYDWENSANEFGKKIVERLK